jgi:hypothetical protein
MSKDRARRRAEREAVRAAALAVRLRRERRRDRRAALVRRLRPRQRNLAWGLGRRTPAQRSVIVGVAIGLLFAVWYFVDALGTRIALSVLTLLILPVVVVVAFDRKGTRL